MFKLQQFLFTFLLLFCCSYTNNYVIVQEIKGKVIKIKDGDTIDILLNGKPLTIRLAHIDCPEKKQAFSQAAQQFTANKCFGQLVTIIGERKLDRNKRLIGEVINQYGENVNKELVKAGLAWHFVKYSTDNTYAQLEAVARQQKAGLWIDPNPTPPWQWRKKKKDFNNMKW